MASPSQQLNRTPKKNGIALWMERVLEGCDLASATLDPDTVHDLRVALRRCRSIADGIMAIDPDPAWKQMKKAGKDLFRSLGALRDVHVMQEWVRRLGASDDPVTAALSQHLSASEILFKQEATKAVGDFDRKQWKKWSAVLTRPAARLRPGSPVFKHLALVRWMQAHELHRIALRNRSKVAFHNLRIGLKKFRYVVENFLPEQHLAWSEDLKQLQDLLGDAHDLDVLWTTLLRINAFPTIESRSHWNRTITLERSSRIEQYRRKMLGKNSLWQVWRVALPHGNQVRTLALSRLKRWASVLDPDFAHSGHVAKLALQLYDAFPAKVLQSNSDSCDSRAILQVAALLHDVGRSTTEKKPHKASYKLMNGLTPPVGLSAEELHLAAVVSRYHQGALPRAGQVCLRGLLPSQRQSVFGLAGILRLSHAFDAGRDRTITSLSIEQRKDFLVITAPGYFPRNRLAQGIAAARHLLETVCKRPIIVRGSSATSSG